MNALVRFERSCDEEGCEPSRGDSAALPTLSLAALAGLPVSVRRPSFDPAQLQPRILHLGCGAFHRAHQAVITQRAIEHEAAHRGGSALAPPPAWGIVSASLRTPEVVRALRQQQGLYSVVERGSQTTHVEVVGTLRELLYVPEQTDALAARFLDPELRLVTLTVTAVGYCTDPATGRLDVNHPDIAAGLRGANASASAVGVLVGGLAARRACGLRPPVVLSCDNIPTNGKTLRQACIDFASLGEAGLARWIESSVQFPCSVVDRIVPTATAADVDEATRLLGRRDAAPVSAEPYFQWVVECFDGERPDWEGVGVQFVPDVAPWEASKLGLLNGGHLAVAYLGLLAGETTVADAMARPGFVSFVLRLMLKEQCPTLPSSDHDIGAYARQLIERWRNPRIVHQLERICRDGSSKLPARLLAPLRANLRAGRPAPCTILAIAAWICCVFGRDPTGRPLSLNLVDGLAEKLPRPARRPATHDEHAHWVDSVLAWPEVFGTDLPRFQQLRDGLVRCLGLLARDGACGAVAACAATERT